MITTVNLSMPNFVLFSETFKMNKILVFGGITFASLLLYFGYLMSSNKKKRVLKRQRMHEMPKLTNFMPCSLDDDLSDIIAFIPLREVRSIFLQYAKYDKQVNRTLSMIRRMDNKLYEEFLRIPEIRLFLIFLRQNGFTLTRWYNDLKLFWESLPEFNEENLSPSSGGVESLINDLLLKIPIEELDCFIGQKVCYSSSLRQFLSFIGSRRFSNICYIISKNEKFNKILEQVKNENIDTDVYYKQVMKLYNYSTNHLYNYYDKL